MQREEGAPTSTGKAPTMASKQVAQARGSVLDAMLASIQYDEWGMPGEAAAPAQLYLQKLTAADAAAAATGHQDEADVAYARYRQSSRELAASYVGSRHDAVELEPWSTHYV